MRLLLLLILIQYAPESYQRKYNWIQSTPVINSNTKINQSSIMDVDNNKSPTYYNTRIIKGSVARPGQFPFQAAILGRKGDSQKLCGGSLITPSSVLTAAHCLDYPERVDLAVVLLGANSLAKESPNEREIECKSFTIHKGWNATSRINDIAIIKLPKPITYTDKIKPIKLPPLMEKQNLFTGQTGVVSGFGYTNPSDRKLSPLLQYAEQKIISNQKCTTSFKGVVSTSVCAMSPNSGACNGDSGGPLMIVKNGVPVLVGITSYGPQSCTGLPTVFTRLTSFIDFVADQTKGEL